MVKNTVKFETMYPFSHAVEEAVRRIELDIPDEFADLPIIRIGNRG